MMTDREIMQQAFEALTCSGEDDDPGHRCTHCDDYVDRNGPLRAALRERLAQPEQKPVAWRYKPMVGSSWSLTDDGYYISCKRDKGYIVDSLYTAPPKRTWVDLTDEQIAEALGFGEHTTATTRAILTHAARAIEAKIKENK